MTRERHEPCGPRRRTLPDETFPYTPTSGFTSSTVGNRTPASTPDERRPAGPVTRPRVEGLGRRLCARRRSSRGPRALRLGHGNERVHHHRARSAADDAEHRRGSPPARRCRSAPASETCRRRAANAVSHRSRSSCSSSVSERWPNTRWASLQASIRSSAQRSRTSPGAPVAADGIGAHAPRVARSSSSTLGLPLARARRNGSSCAPPSSPSPRCSPSCWVRDRSIGCHMRLSSASRCLRR